MRNWHVLQLNLLSFQIVELDFVIAVLLIAYESWYGYKGTIISDGNLEIGARV